MDFVHAADHRKDLLGLGVISHKQPVDNGIAVTGRGASQPIKPGAGDLVHLIGLDGIADLDPVMGLTWCRCCSFHLVPVSPRRAVAAGVRIIVTGRLLKTSRRPPDLSFEASETISGMQKLLSESSRQGSNTST